MKLEVTKRCVASVLVRGGGGWEVVGDPACMRIRPYLRACFPVVTTCEFYEFESEFQVQVEFGRISCGCQCQCTLVFRCFLESFTPKFDSTS